jgi:hypothetical protein
MFNLKWSIYAGAFALILSLLVGFVSGAGFPFFLLRALVFGGIFFVLAGGAWIIMNQFIPELLHPEETDSFTDEEVPGSRVNISVGDSPAGIAATRNGGAAAIPASDSEEDIGNITDLLSGVRTAQAASISIPEGNSPPMDQNDGNGYNRGEENGVSRPASSKGGETGPEGSERLESVDALPDLDSMAGTFLSSEEEEPGDAEALGFEASSVEEITPQPRPKRASREAGMAGDFNPKDLASAIQTILSKDD